MATKIDPRRIRTDLNTQSRLHLCEQTVKEYAKAMEAGDEFPAIIVFYDEPNNQFILADGFHRLAAHQRIRSNDFILAEQRLGTAGNARWVSSGANREHGLRPTLDDKRFAIKQALTTDEGEKSSDRQLGRHVGVDHKTVAVVRRELELTGEIPQSTHRTGQDGRTIHTAGINADREVASAQIESSKPTFAVNTSRINFGGKVIPEGATCGQCRYFEDQKCLTDEIESPLPWKDVCDEFAVQVQDAPPMEFPPPDYENFKPLGRKLNRKHVKRLHQELDLKNCIALHLPSNNPEMFAVELREHWPKPYLIECLSALKRLLEEDYYDEDKDEEDEDEEND